MLEMYGKVKFAIQEQDNTILFYHPRNPRISQTKDYLFWLRHVQLSIFSQAL